MQHQRHAGSFERAAGELGPRGARGGRQPLSVYPGEIHAAALEYVPALDDAALTAAAFAALPLIAAEAASFDTLQLRDKAVLQIKKISVDRGWVHRTIHRSGSSCGNGAVTDVAPILHAVEADGFH